MYTKDLMKKTAVCFRLCYTILKPIDNHGSWLCSNIDTRIQQAELQYKLGREELELLTLGEQARALAQLIEQADAAARRCHAPSLYK